MKVRMGGHLLAVEVLWTPVSGEEDMQDLISGSDGTYGVVLPNRKTPVMVGIVQGLVAVGTRDGVAGALLAAYSRSDDCIAVEPLEDGRVWVGAVSEGHVSFDRVLDGGEVAEWVERLQAQGHSRLVGAGAVDFGGEPGHWIPRRLPRAAMTGPLQNELVPVWQYGVLGVVAAAVIATLSSMLLEEETPQRIAQDPVVEAMAMRNRMLSEHLSLPGVASFLSAARLALPRYQGATTGWRWESFSCAATGEPVCTTTFEAQGVRSLIPALALRLGIPRSRVGSDVEGLKATVQAGLEMQVIPTTATNDTQVKVDSRRLIDACSRLRGWHLDCHVETARIPPTLSGSAVPPEKMFRVGEIAVSGSRGLLDRLPQVFGRETDQEGVRATALRIDRERFEARLSYVE